MVTLNLGSPLWPAPKWDSHPHCLPLPHLPVCGALATQEKPQHPWGNVLGPPPRPGVCQRLFRLRRCQIPGLLPWLSGLQTAPLTRSQPQESPGAGRWVFGIPPSSCPGRRFSSFQAGRENPAPLPSTCSQRKTLAEPLILSPSLGRMASSCLPPGLGKFLGALQVPGFLKLEWPFQSSNPLPPPHSGLPGAPFSFNAPALFP